MQCRAHAAQLGRLYPEIRARGCEVLVILGEPVEMAQRYAEVLHLPFAVLADPQREVYHRYGLNKVLLLQRSASLIVDREGRIRYLKRTINSLTWLEESQVLLRELGGYNH